MSNIPTISIVSPVYCAENIVDKLVDRVRTALDKITPNYEIILVEDGGPDNSWEKIQENCKKYSNIRGIKLSRNFGQQHAIQAGLDASRGDYVVTIDCDLQDKPEEIYKLYNKAKEGYEIVVASRKNRRDDVLKKLLSKIFNKTLGYLTETEQDSSVANFVIYHRKVINVFREMKDNNRYYPMMMQWVGFNLIKVEVEHAKREDGKSSYSFKKRLDLAINSILAFSDKPLKLIVKFGISLAFFSFCVAVLLVVLYFQGNVKVHGWASLALLLSFFSGAIISVLGMVGIYVGRTFESVKNRPTYIIHKTIN